MKGLIRFSALRYPVRVERTNGHDQKAIAHLHARIEKDTSP